jgi:hypothetical protein
MVVYSFFSRIVKVVGALTLSKLVCRIQANQTNERNTGTSVKQRKNIFQVRDTLCILSYCVLSQTNWNVFFLRFVSNRIVRFSSAVNTTIVGHDSPRIDCRSVIYALKYVF